MKKYRFNGKKEKSLTNNSFFINGGTNNNNYYYSVINQTAVGLFRNMCLNVGKTPVEDHPVSASFINFFNANRIRKE